MRNKDKKFTWTDEAQVSFENIKREFCEPPVIIGGRDVERDCHSIVNQLVTSMPKDVLLRVRSQNVGNGPRSKSLKQSGSSRNPASREKYNSLMQKKSTSRAQIVLPGTRLCPGSQAPSGPSRTNCTGRG